MQVNWTDDFGRLYKQRGQQKHGIRLLALWKLQTGMTETDVCQLIGKTHKTIREWRRLYEKSGIDGLLSIAPGRGRKAKVDLYEHFADDIKCLQEERDGGRIRCQDVVDLVYVKHGVQYTTSGMYHILHRLGFSWITSRSKHPQNNPEAMEAFKKTSKTRYKKQSQRESS
jgi:transposase